MGTETLWNVLQDNANWIFHVYYHTYSHNLHIFLPKSCLELVSKICGYYLSEYVTHHIKLRLEILLLYNSEKRHYDHFKPGWVTVIFPHVSYILSNHWDRKKCKGKIMKDRECWLAGVTGIPELRQGQWMWDIWTSGLWCYKQHAVVMLLKV